MVFWDKLVGFSDSDKLEKQTSKKKKKDKIGNCKVVLLFFYLGFFHERSKFTGQQGKEAVLLNLFYLFYPLHRHLDIS